MKKTCSTCTFWESGKDYDPPKPYGICHMADDPDYCDKHHGLPLPSRDGVVVDSRRGFAYLRTGPDFGCIHWQSENEEP